MPRLPIDYSKTVMYKLVHKDDLDDVNVYVGNTTDFTRRKRQHKCSCNNPNLKEYNQKKYEFIRENGGWDEWTMIKIEDYNCKDVHEAIQRERYWMKELKAKLNVVEPGRSYKEYYEDNADKLKEYKKQYDEKNADKLKELYKRYREENPDKIKEKNKQYYEENVDKLKEYNKKYREENPDKVKEIRKKKYEKNKEKLKEKIKCDKCNSIVSLNCLTRHKKSQKCINNKSCNIIENGLINKRTA